MTPILANLVWPALYLLNGLLAVWPIAAGLCVEFFFVRYATNLRGWRCVAGDLSMNLASTVLGIVLIPLFGFAWDFLATFTLYALFTVGPFNPLGWGVNILLAAGANTAIEGLVLRRAFHQVLNRRALWLLFAANLVSVAIAYASITMDKSLWPLLKD